MLDKIRRALKAALTTTKVTMDVLHVLVVAWEVYRHSYPH
jgi:hypothetical protein